MIGKPSEPAHKSAFSNSLQIGERLGPIKAAAGGGQDRGGLADATGEVGAIDAVDGGLFPV